jgi:hypothetical protein
MKVTFLVAGSYELGGDTLAKVVSPGPDQTQDAMI